MDPKTYVSDDLAIAVECMQGEGSNMNKNQGKRKYFNSDPCDTRDVTVIIFNALPRSWPKLSSLPEFADFTYDRWKTDNAVSEDNAKSKGYKIVKLELKYPEYVRWRKTHSKIKRRRALLEFGIFKMKGFSQGRSR